MVVCTLTTWPCTPYQDLISLYQEDERHDDGEYSILDSSLELFLFGDAKDSDEDSSQDSRGRALKSKASRMSGRCRRDCGYDEESEKMAAILVGCVLGICILITSCVVIAKYLAKKNNSVGVENNKKSEVEVCYVYEMPPVHEQKPGFVYV